MVSEGRRRGLPLSRIAELICANPAKRYGLHTKGDIAEGLDADIALVDPNVSWVVRAEESLSSQEYTPFEGFELTARVTDTFVRGNHVFSNGKMLGQPVGRFIKRPVKA